MRIGVFAPNLRARCDGAVRFVRVLIDDLRIFRRGIGLVIRPAPLAAAVFLVLGAVLTVTPVAQVLLAKFVVDSLADQAATAAFTFAVLYILTLLVPAGVAPIQSALTSWLEARAVAEVDYSLIDNSVRLVDLDHIEQPAYQDEVQLLQENAYFPPRLFHHMQGWLGRLLSLVGMLVLLIGLHPLIPLALGVSGGLSLMARRRHNIDVWAAMRKSDPSYARDGNIVLKLQHSRTRRKKCAYSAWATFSSADFAGEAPWSWPTLRGCASFISVSQRCSAVFPRWRWPAGSGTSRPRPAPVGLLSAT